MKTLTLFFALLIVSATASVRAEEGPLKAGQKLDDVAARMKAAGFKETGLELVANKVGTALKMWAVGEGVLIVSYSKQDGTLIGLSYSLSDERPKATRKTFDFVVEEFDPQTRAMKIKIGKAE